MWTIITPDNNRDQGVRRGRRGQVGSGGAIRPQPEIQYIYICTKLRENYSLLLSKARWLCGIKCPDYSLAAAGATIFCKVE